MANLLFCFVVCFVHCVSATPCLSAQNAQNVEATPVAAPQSYAVHDDRLSIVLNESFESYVAENYQITGDVRNEGACLVIPPNARIKRAFPPTIWSELTVDFPKDALEFQGVFRAGFLEGETEAVAVVFELAPKERGVLQSLRVYAIDRENPSADLKLVREFKDLAIDLTQVTITERAGLVSVQLPDEVILRSYIPGQSGAIDGIFLESEQQVWKANQVIYALEHESKMTLSEEQKTSVARTRQRHAEMVELFQAGQFDKALNIAHENLETMTEVLGEDSRAVATSLNDLSVLYQNLGKYESAMEYQGRALELRRRLMGNWHPDVGQSLNNLATTYVELARYQDARPLFEESLQINRAVFGRLHSNYTAALTNFAQLASQQGRYGEAIETLREGLELDVEIFGKEHYVYGLDLNNLAKAYADAGDERIALRLYLEAVNVLENALGEHHPFFISTLTSIGATLQDLGDLAQAESIYLRAFAAAREHLGEEDRTYATCLNCLGAIYDELGEHEKALDYLTQALKARRRIYGESHPDVSRTLNNLSGTLKQLQRVDEAAQRLSESLKSSEELLGENHPSHMSGQRNLALLEYEHRDLQAAQEQLHSLLKRLDNEEQPNLRLYASVEEALGRTLYFEQNYSEAARLFASSQEKLLRVAKQLIPGLSAAQARAWVTVSQPDPGRLLSALEKLDAPDSAAAYESVWESHALVSRLQVDRRVQGTLSPEAATILGQLKDAQVALANLVSATPQPGGESEFRNRVAEASQRKEDLERQLGEINQISRKQIAIRDATVSQLANLLPKGVAVLHFVRRDRWIAELVEAQTIAANGEKKQTKRRLDAVQPVYDAFVLRSDRPAGQYPAKWIPLNPADAIDQAIEQWRMEFTGEEAPNSERGLGRESAELQAQEIPAESPIKASPSLRLRKLLWEPLEPELEQIQTVIVIPDGQLHRLPWSAIPGNQPNTFLLEDYTVSTAVTAQQLFGLLSTTLDAGSDALLVAGDIDYNGVDGVDSVSPDRPEELLLAETRAAAPSPDRPLWKPLLGANLESSEVAKRWGSRGPLLQLSGTQANEDRLLTELPTVRFAHLATHGFFEDSKEVYAVDLRNRSASIFGNGADEGISTGNAVAARNPMLMTGLVSAGANKLPNRDTFGLPVGPDGLLTGEELLGLNLRQMELVTLSACETGLGDLASGDGVMGLQRAFHDAGARSVVASLWKVDDAATRALMQEFYRNLWDKKMPKAVALRQAQLALIENFDTNHGELIRGLGSESGKLAPPTKTTAEPSTHRLSPKYWAAFQLSGDWR